MNWIDEIKYSFSDLSNEYTDYKQMSEYDRKVSPQKYFGSRSTSDSDAMVKLLIPHFIGMFVGCAFARLFCMSAAGYFILAFIFAFISGTVKNHAIDNIQLKYAMIRNGIIALIGLVLIGIVFLLSSVLH